MRLLIFAIFLMSSNFVFSMGGPSPGSSTPTPEPEPPAPAEYVLPNFEEHQVPQDLLGFNAGFMFNVQQAYLKPEAEALMAQLPQKTVRFPGGRTSMCYHLYKKNSTEYAPGYGMRKSSLFQNNGDGECGYGSLNGLYNWQVNYQPRNILFDFTDHMKRVGGSVIYVPNIVWGSLQEVKDVMNYFVAHEIQIDKVEMGNEFYFNAYKKTGEVRDANHYIQIMRPYVEMFKNDFPSVKISIVAPAHYEDPSMGGVPNWIEEWNNRLAQEVAEHPNDYTGVSIHIYPNSKDCIGTPEEVALCSFPKVSNLQAKILPGVRSYASEKFPSLKTWLTEWNFNTSSRWGDMAGMINTMMQGCFAAEMIGGLIRNSDYFEVASYHAYITQGVSNGAVFLNFNSDFETLNGDERMTATTGFYAHLFAQKALEGNSKWIVRPHLELITLSGEHSDKALALLLRSEQGKEKVFFVNCSGEQMNLKSTNLKRFSSYQAIESDKLYYSGGASGWSKDSGASSEEGQKVQLIQSSFSSKPSQVQLKKYSYGVFELE